MPLDRISETEQETIVRIVKQITRAGENEPNPQQLKAFKDFCKKSNAHTTAAYEAIFMQLRTKHAQVRLASLQLLVVLYERSQRARSLTHKDLNDWIQLTVGVHNEKLPPPKEYANRVRQLMLNSLRSWHDQRGERHRELRLAYEYLKHDIGVDFGDTRGAAARLTHRNDETAEEKQEKIRRNARLKRYEAIRQTIERGMPLVKENLMDMESCFNILVPNLFEDSMSSPDSQNETQLSSSNSTTTTSLRQTVYEHGLGSSRYSLTINLGDADRAEVAENPENHILFEELRSGRRLLRSHHLPRVSEWLDALGHSESEIPQARDTMLKECIDLKERVELALQKCDELNITDERDEDDEFEEVPVYGNDKESSVKHKDTKATSCTEQSSKSMKSTLRGLFAPMDFPGIEQDPTYAHTSKTSSTLSSVAQGKQPMDMNNKVDEQQQQQLSNTAKDNNNNDNDDGESETEKLDPERAALLATAPYVEYGDDIHYWNEHEIPINSSGLELSHRFYGTANPDSTLSEAGMRRYKLRAIPLSHLVDKSFADGSASNDEPVAESSTSTDVKRVNKQDKSSAIPLWQQIADDVYRETAPGSAGVHNGKQRRKRSRYDGPGLVDIHKAKKTSHQRIMERFSDRNMRKVAEDSIVYRQRMRDRDRKISHW